MTAIASIVIDPCLVLLPNPCYSAEQVETFVEGLLNWSAAIDRIDLDWFFSERCLEVLFDEKTYPYENHITNLLANYRVDAADTETINNLIRGVFERTPTLESRVGIEDITCDESTVSISLPELCSRLGDNLGKAFRDSLLTVAVGQSYLATITNDCLIATTNNIDITPRSSFHLSAAGIIFITHPNCTATVHDADLPLRVTTDYTLCLSHDDVLRSTKPIALWDHAASDAAALDAIRARIVERLDAGYTGEISPLNYRLGSYFLERARHFGFGSRTDWASLLIDACARVVLGIDQLQHDLKEFRTDDRTQAPQRKREDGATAWRLHLTKDSEGFRLMLWRLPDGTIEFANVGPKKELVIYD